MFHIRLFMFYPLGVRNFFAGWDFYLCVKSIKNDLCSTDFIGGYSHLTPKGFVQCSTNFIGGYSHLTPKGFVHLWKFLTPKG